MPSPCNKFRHVTLVFDDPLKVQQTVSSFAKSSATLLVSDTKVTNNLTQIPPVQVNQYLGQELSSIMFDARKNFNVNSFVAICGCLIGGGEIIIHLPHELSCITSKSNDNCVLNKSSPTLIRLVSRLLQKAETCVFLNEKESTIPNAQLYIPEENNFSKEQQNVIHKIKKCALGHAKRPLVITANRGRGKSAALGIAAAELLFENNKKILVTAPRRGNVNIFFKYFNDTFTYLCDVNRSEKLLPSEQRKLVHFISPDELIKTKPDADFVIVEEAGAIPIQMLKIIASKYNRFALSTTVDGYEGNGQGFQVRFKSYLETNFPQWRSTTLTHPIRWPINDPLESALNEAFLLSFKDKYQSQANNINLEKICFSQVNQSDLMQNENLLTQIYQLLVTAHYQTRPSDLERMLGDKSLLIFIATSDGNVVATALVCVEGKLPEEDCNAIETGQKRLAGNLLPQSLMGYQGDASAGLLKFWRVMRIATHPIEQEKGVASRLLSFINLEAEKNFVDIIGTSFSLNARLNKFWYRLGFSCCRIAIRKDSSTGNFPGEFIKLTERSRSQQQAFRTFHRSINKFNQSFMYSVSGTYRDVATDIIASLIDNQQQTLISSVQEYKSSEIKRYLNAARSYEMVEWDLFCFINSYFLNRKTKQIISKQEENLLIAKLFQKKSWQLISAQFEINGKKVAQKRVQEIIKKIYSADDE